MADFESGKIIVTNRVATSMYKDPEFAKFVANCLYERYFNLDWGDICERDAETNNYALEHECRIMAKYKQSNTETAIYIFTEWDRSETVIMFPDEY